jgi:predicted dehydrogenase
LKINHKDYDSEDTAFIILESEKGVAQITVTWAADKRYNSASAICSNSSISYRSGNGLIINSKYGSEEIKVSDMSDKSHYTSLYIDLFVEFLSAIKNNIKREEWIEDAYKSVYILEKCFESSVKENNILWL